MEQKWLLLEAWEVHGMMEMYKTTPEDLKTADQMNALRYLNELKTAEENGIKTPLTCKICKTGKMFTARSSLKNHYESHADLKPHKCTICGRGFGRKSSLNYHLKVHAGEFNFTCPTCGKKFRHSYHFRNTLPNTRKTAPYSTKRPPRKVTRKQEHRHRDRQAKMNEAP